MAWTLELSGLAQRNLGKLDPQVARRILGFLNERVATQEDPRSIGEALKGSDLGEYWKYRIGDWRVICEIKDKEIVIVVLRVGNRREVYR